MTKKQIIELATGLGFHIDYDQFEEKGWIRFQLKDELDEQDLRWIWYIDQTLEWNLNNGAQILFKAGQKALRQNLTKYIDL